LLGFVLFFVILAQNGIEVKVIKIILG